MRLLQNGITISILQQLDFFMRIKTKHALRIAVSNKKVDLRKADNIINMKKI